MPNHGTSTFDHRGRTIDIESDFSLLLGPTCTLIKFGWEFLSVQEYSFIYYHNPDLRDVFFSPPYLLFSSSRCYVKI